MAWLQRLDQPLKQPLLDDLGDTWAALLEQHPRRIARAVCHEDSVLLRLNGEAMLDALEADPTSGLMVMRRLATLVARHTTGPQNS